MSPAPYSSKKRHRSMLDDEDDLDISTEIWKLFGKNKSQYVERDVFSDDEDMEADARDVEREEMKRCVLIIFLEALPLMVYPLATASRKRKIRWHWKRNGDTRRRSGGRRRCLGGVNSFRLTFFLALLVLVYWDLSSLIHYAPQSLDFSSSVLSKLPLYINTHHTLPHWIQLHFPSAFQGPPLNRGEQPCHPLISLFSLRSFHHICFPQVPSRVCAVIDT